MRTNDITNPAAGAGRMGSAARAAIERLEDRTLLSVSWWGGPDPGRVSAATVAQAAVHKHVTHGSHHVSVARAAIVAQTTTSTAAITVTRGGFRYNNALKMFQQVITLKNTGTLAVAGPLVLDLDIDTAATNQMNLVQVNNINLIDPTPASDTADGGRGNDVARLMKHSIIFRPPSDSFAAGATVNVTLGFVHLDNPTSFNPGVTYQTRLERPTPPDPALTYVVTGNGGANDSSSRDAGDNVQVTQPTGTRTLTITNTGLSPVIVPTLAIEGFYSTVFPPLDEHVIPDNSLQPAAFTVSSDHQPVAFVDLNSSDYTTQFYGAFLYSLHPANAPANQLQLNHNDTITVNLQILSTPHHRPPKKASGFINMSMK
jgi:hypothetical protein